MWYFLRALWEEDGLTQSELSRRVGTMEPTTLTAIQTMQRNGLVKRIRNKQDRRKLSICLTPKANALKMQLLPIARDVVEQATGGLAPAAPQQCAVRETHSLQSRVLSSWRQSGDVLPKRPAYSTSA